MIRLALLGAGGLVFGVIIHLIVILMVPALAERDVWSKIENLDAFEQVRLLDQPQIGEANGFALDPALLHAVCRLNIAEGPGALEGELPIAFWSIAVFEPGGTIVYSTTNRAASGRQINLGIFNPAQTRLLAEQQLEIEEGLLIVEAPGEDVFVVIRIWPEYPALAERYRRDLAGLSCRTVR